tara:strand:+ start:3390 stop:4403 length:1014 start_codon:yes stop_codon:yes gene_type:complete
MGSIKLDGKPKKFKFALDLKKLGKTEQKLFDSLPVTQQAEFIGLGQGPKIDFDAPSFVPAPAERVLSKGNAGIVIGQDRPSNLFSGYGGLKNTHCASIDLVAGRLGYRARSAMPDGTAVNVDPNFKLDAARIYISQKADPDGYFGLAEGKSGSTSKGSPRSTVAMKADTVRLIARENIKLITRTDAENSQGGDLDTGFTAPFGIDLIAMNDDSGLQPMVKGENLVKLLKMMLESIHDLRELFKNFLEYDRTLTIALMNHTHQSPFFGASTSPSFVNLLPESVKAIVNKLTNVELQLNLQMQKMTTAQQEYLETPAGSETTDDDGNGLYILSKFNNTN